MDIETLKRNLARTQGQIDRLLANDPPNLLLRVLLPALLDEASRLEQIIAEREPDARQ